MTFQLVSMIGAAVFGGLWASFVNVVVYRVPRGESVVSPPSACPQCHERIAWYDNVPVLGWLWLLGKCRRCKAPIAFRYPMIEFVGMVLSAALMMRFGLTPTFLYYFVFAFALLAISFIDLDTWLIPDVISLPGIALGLCAGMFIDDLVWWSRPVGALAGGLFFFLMAKGSEVLLKKEGLGLGDVKLLAMLGAFLGFEALPLIVLFASVQGLLVGITWAKLRKGVPPPPAPDGFQPPPGAVPFGPFLSLGALEVLLFRDTIVVHLVGWLT